MSTVKVIFNEGKINKKGEVPIWLRITKDRKPKYISLGIRVPKSQWNYEDNKVRKSNQNSQRLNNLIAQRVAEAEGKALEMETYSKFTTTKAIKNSIKGVNNVSYMKYAEAHYKNEHKMGKIAVGGMEKSALKKLQKYINEKFLGHVQKNSTDRDLLFFDIDFSFVKNYENYLRKDLSNKTNTVYTSLKLIRKHFKEAYREDLIPMEKNPFLKYKIKEARTERTFLTEEELEIFYKQYLKPDSRTNHYRNMYVFTAYTGGIRVSDLLMLRWENFDGKFLSLKTRKTGSHLTILVPTRGLEILKYYKTPDKTPKDFIFPLLDASVDYSIPQVLYNALTTHIQHANVCLKNVAKACEIEKKVHFHSSRHTFATLALKKGMRIEYVSKLLTHSNITTTQIYAKIVNADLEKAMEIFN